MSLNEVMTMVITSVWFYIVIVVVALLILWMIYRKMTKKKIRKQLKALDYDYQSMKSIPISFKLNKAVALSRMNQEVADTLQGLQETYDETQANMKTISQLLSDSDDLSMLGKYKLAKQNNRDLEQLISTTQVNVKQLNEVLDGILQQETEQREKINQLKEEFRNLKIDYNEHSNQYIYSYEAIESKISEIEKLFSNFEECMYSSEFQQASDVKEEIVTRLAYVQRLYRELPELLTMARGILPRTVDEVSSTYAQAKQKGVYLKHLEIARNIEFITESMKADLHVLKNAEIDDVQEHLSECQKRLQQLLQQIEKECKSYDEANTMKNLLFADIDRMNQMIVQVKKIYQDASLRFGFENMEDTIQSLENDLHEFVSKREEIQTQMEENRTSATSWLIALRELRQSVDIKSAELKIIQEKLDHACQDESHAKAQLLKLYLIMNEMKSRVRKHRIQSISESYEEDLKTAYSYVNSIESLLEEIPLNISLLNKTLTEAIDFIYRLYNNVNKILGSATMVEDAVVVGNRCRSTYPEVDVDLTRAELAYRNGEYTKALSIAFRAIEKVYPDSAETMIKSNAQKG
ncbi:MAG: septation ring formation regulator EzrA [Erysipelotrichaceae bacterium]|nr:septation ring formation regulator EzrA [Erysipelotrichaceae bacterium]